MSASADGRVSIGRQRDGRWRWTWCDPERPDDELVSNETYSGAEEARSSAAEAFPDAEVVQEEDDDGSPPPRHRLRRVVVLVAGAAVVVFLLSRSGARPAPAAAAR